MPVIAGGADPFGGIAQQQYAWAGFNANRDDANARRLQEADQSQNNYLARLAQMQREDAARADSLAVADRRTAADFIVGERRAREQARQFDTNVDLTKAEQAVRAKQFDYARGKEDRAKTEQDRVTENLAQNLAPDVQAAATGFEEAQAQHERALNDLKTRVSEWQGKIPAGAVVYNPRTNEFEPALKGGSIPPAIQPQIVEANKDLASVQSNYLTAKNDLDYRSKAFQTVQQHAYQNGLIVSKRGKNWMVYSPTLDKSFGEMVKDAKDGAPMEDLSAGAEIGARPTTLSWNNPDGGAGAGNDLGAWKMPAGFDSPVADSAPVPVQSPTAPPTFMYANGNLTPASQSPVSASAPVADAPGGFVPVSPTAPVAAAGPAAVDPNFRVPKFNSPDDILKLYRAGAITLTEAKKLAQSEFNGYLGDLAFETEERKQENPDVYKWRPWRK